MRGFGCFRPVFRVFSALPRRAQNTPFWPVFGCFRPNRFWTSKSQVSRTYHGQRLGGFWPLLGVPKTVPKRPKTGRNPQTFVQIMSLGPGSWEAYGAQHAKRAKARPGKTGVLPGPTIKIYRCQNRQNEGVFREGVQSENPQKGWFGPPGRYPENSRKPGLTSKDPSKKVRF